VLGLAVVALLGLGCGDDDDGGQKNTFLFENNAQFNGGRTVRWRGLPVRVFLGNGVASEGEVNVWTSATGGLVTFAFVGSAGGANITFRFRGGTDICGITQIEFTDNGDLTLADVAVSQSIYRGPQCVRTVTHETAHAIGFLSHTSDGGLMDDDGGNGEITPPVAQMFRDLYSLSPGTAITALRKRPHIERRKGGRNVMTFIHPVRRLVGRPRGGAGPRGRGASLPPSCSARP
jgi:hypothetical protein